MFLTAGWCLSLPCRGPAVTPLTSRPGRAANAGRRNRAVSLEPMLTARGLDRGPDGNRRPALGCMSHEVVGGVCRRDSPDSGVVVDSEPCCRGSRPLPLTRGPIRFCDLCRFVSADWTAILCIEPQANGSRESRGSRVRQRVRGSPPEIFRGRTWEKLGLDRSGSVVSEQRPAACISAGNGNRGAERRSVIGQAAGRSGSGGTARLVASPAVHKRPRSCSQREQESKSCDWNRREGAPLGRGDDGLSQLSP